MSPVYLAPIMRALFFAVVFMLTAGGVASGRAQGEIPPLPADWFRSPPTPARIAEVQAVVATAGWIPTSAGIYAGAIGSYERGQIDAAEAWYYVAKWTNLLGQSQAAVGKRWWQAINKTGLNNSNLHEPGLNDETMARLITPDMAAWLMGDRAFSASFWSMVSPCDYLPQVLVILSKLREDNPARFKAYTQLALAISLVYDTPPPPTWPHAQVSQKALPRQLMRPWEVFSFLAEADGHGLALHKLGQLSASELRFAVDLAAPFPELVWAQKSLKFTLAQMPQSYSSVRYRQDRITSEQYIWPGDSYELSRIYKEGGICVDQAYFASQTGKARGVPTLLFVGEGRDGRHAWFGYLDHANQWMFDAGRYEDQKFVTGVAYDPQTWGLVSDHELKFLSEGFRKLPPYKISHVHTLFADLYLRLGEKGKPAAIAAARKAVNFERRNDQAWGILIAAHADAPPKTREGVLREAAMALQRYPDLNAYYLRELATSLRARGETSAASFEERSVALKNKGARADIGIEQAGTMIDAVLTDTPVPQQMSVYHDVLQKYGPGAGMDFYDRVVEPFVTALARQGHRGEARAALGEARFVLKPEFQSQLETEIIALDTSIK